MNSEFLNIWEIDPNFRCPVVGAMLSVEKHKNILKKCGYNIKELKPYEYHQVIMGKLSDKNSVSLKVNNFIRHHAGKYMKKISTMDQDEIYTLWKDTLKNGDSGPLLYAIAAKPDSDIELIHEVYGDTHMLAHSNMTEVLTIRKQVKTMEERLSSERKKYLSKTEEIKNIVLRNKEFIAEIEALKRSNLAYERQLKEKENVKTHDETILLKNEIEELKQKVKEYESDLSRTERRKKAIEIEFLSVKNENESLKEELDRFISNFKSIIPEETGESICEGPSCPQYQLCAKRVCMVGGMTKMKSMYKKIVENAGGEFFYDDGYFKNKNSNLEAFVKKSDVILCPVNCNSHNACLKVKKLCNRYNKKVKFLNSSSLTSVTQALFENEEEHMIS